jgi:hypothetical protein
MQAAPPTEQASELSPGARELPPWPPGHTPFDQYVVEELLGAGGMGQVYRVRNALTDALFVV